jgi:hypothetical protein
LALVSDTAAATEKSVQRALADALTAVEKASSVAELKQARADHQGEKSALATSTPA